MSKTGSVAPKERINIKYTPATEGQTDEVELPLKLLVTGDFKGAAEDLSLEERETVSIDKHNFDAVMKQSNLRYYVAVAQRFNLLFLLHFLIFYVRKVRIVNDKTKINFGKCA